MFKFTIESTKDVKRINIEFGDDTSDVIVNQDEIPAVAVEPQASPSVPAKARKAPNQHHKYDPFERAAQTTNYAVKDKPRQQPEEPEVKEDVMNRPDKVDTSFANSDF